MYSFDQINRMHNNVLLEYKCTRRILVLDLRGKNKIYNFWC